MRYNLPGCSTFRAAPPGLIQAQTSAVHLLAGQTSNSRTGWTIGGGVEWMFAPHWSAFLEGNYMDFGSTSGNVTVAGVVPVTVKATESNVLVGVNYHFF